MAKYFTDDEFRCNGDNCCGHALPDNGMHPDLMRLLDALREKVGKPITVLSGYRCPVHNAEVGGVPNSQHTLGIASDLCYDGMVVDEFAQLVRDTMNELGILGGIGRYYGQGFVHVDVRGEEARWEG